MMLKQWVPAIEDIKQEISRLRAAVADAEFNSDFGHKMQIVKLRTAELNERLGALTHQIKSAAGAEHEMISSMLAEYHSERKATVAALAELRMFRAERSRANYRHIMELQKQQEEKGGEA